MGGRWSPRSIVGACAPWFADVVGSLVIDVVFNNAGVSLVG